MQSFYFLLIQSGPDFFEFRCDAAVVEDRGKIHLELHQTLKKKKNQITILFALLFSCCFWCVLERVNYNSEEAVEKMQMYSVYTLKEQ